MAKMTEKQFLIDFALRYFNDQYTRKIKVEDCDIVSIPVRYGFERSYQVNTTRLDDNLRLHMHIRFEGYDGLSKYRVEVDSILSQLLGNENSLIDEVYVATGSIDPYYKNEGIYKFRYIGEDPTLNNFLLQENGDPILFESGQPILFEV